ncbi:MAG TPA: DUF711 domain-containing protein [Anaerolineaceae bacterium]|nr:DUF711 domain-containing protein [Anaerolineaceae bacterium]
MKIRSITSFVDPKYDLIDAQLKPLSLFSRELRAAVEAESFEVESTRLATSPFPGWLTGSLDEQISVLKNVETAINAHGWDYLSVGPATPGMLEAYKLIPELLAATQNIFFGGIISDNRAVYPPAVIACAKIIQQTSILSPDGFANLRFAALANVPPHAPFFPAAYHAAGEPAAFSLAMECADEAVKAFSSDASLEQARSQFLISLESASDRLTPICERIAQKHHVIFKGFDFSPAPFPEDWCSLGKAFELLGLERIGSAGSLAAAAFIADALDAGRWPRIGFNGLMLAVMEDSVLAKRAAEGGLSIKDLLLYSAVCGTGLDTIPLPGDTSIDELAAILLDLASLATRLGKPLTGRLMPIPGKREGDATEFEFGYFANSRVINTDGQIVSAPIMSAAEIPLKPRKVHL